MSKYKTSKCRLINPARSKRFKAKVRGSINPSNPYILGHGNPGPGHYDEKPVSMSNKGNYFISKLKNSGCNFFNKQKRRMGKKANPSPGPGSYRMPSDFGYYESNKPVKWKRIRI